MSGFPREAAASAPLEAFAGWMRARGYDEEGVRARLDLPDVAALRLERFPLYLFAYLGRGEPLDRLIALFLLSAALAEPAAHKLLGERLPMLLACGLLERLEDGRIAAAASLYPCQGGLFATDHRFRHTPRLEESRPAQPVMYLGGDSYALARLTPRRKVSSCLDLCTGSGVHAILAARHSERVVGVDLNPRAVAFARFNARLNGAAVDFREGDAYGPVGDERFALILGNPPFVPSPAVRIAFRDGGPQGEDVLAKIVAGLPQHLAEGGRAQIVTHLVEHSGEPYRGKLERWLGDARWDSWLVRFGSLDPFAYAVEQVKRGFGQAYPDYRDTLMRWVSGYMEQRISGIGAGLIHLWRTPAGKAWHRDDEVLPPLCAAGDRVDAQIARRTLLAGADDAALDALEVAPPEGAQLVRRTDFGGGTSAQFVTPEGPLQRTLDVVPRIARLLEAAGRGTPVAALVAEAETRGEPAAATRKALRALLELGMLVPSA